MTVRRIGIAGAGTMGAGIAQLACLGGYETLLHDPQPEALERGSERVRADLRRGAERERWSAAAAEAASARLSSAPQIGDLGACDLVVEAVPERLELKRELFAALENACGPQAVLATNTSSLPVGEIAAQAERPERICGMHFFNPPALMKLVEVVAAERTGESALSSTVAVAERMGRTPVRCSDSPGFIVNRCNRPFALESLRILDEGIATHAQIDAVIREDGGYRMGPFELMDLIGIDVNLAVAQSFYRQRPVARWKPHPISERMVEEGRLGRKSGEGFYRYEGRATSSASRPGQDKGRATSSASRPGVPGLAGGSELDPEVREAVLLRVVAQLVNEASFALEEGVAERGDIDLAMRLGLNHPRGPFEWLDELGGERVVATLEALRERTGDERYEVAPSLRMS